MEDKKMYSLFSDGDLDRILKFLQDNNAEIVQVFPCYGGYGCVDEMHFSTTICVLYKSEKELEYKRVWELD